MPEATEPAAYCATTPRITARPTSACPDCGHAAILHVGVAHCPVCELVDLNQQARSGAHPIADIASDLTHAEKALAEAERRHKLGLPRAAYRHPEANDA